MGNVSVNYLKSESNSLLGKDTINRLPSSYNSLSEDVYISKTLIRDLPNYSKIDMDRYENLP